MHTRCLLLRLRPSWSRRPRRRCPRLRPWTRRETAAGTRGR
uniref:Uncharacterized protein n=1 Tax=Arundo donax TaxID=35708 RepID=A0A0A9BT45_ARUDO